MTWEDKETSVSSEIREGTNFHTLHCDESGCRVSYTLRHYYGHLNQLSQHAAIDGWQAVEVGHTRRDFYPAHRPLLSKASQHPGRR